MITGKRAALYLAAAVADFYIPLSQMATDKIQSSDGGLSLSLFPVPKIIPFIKISESPWAPSVFLVSFKLETNENILTAKAAGAINNYGVDVVVANILNNHRNKLHLVQRENGAKSIEFSKSKLTGSEVDKVTVVGITEQTIHKQVNQEIEVDLVNAVIEMHQLYQQQTL
jgi:phosphopantothenate-cysteine ligase